MPKVTCVTKPHPDSPHEAITRLGGPGWNLTRQQVVAAIKDGDTYFTNDGVKLAILEVRTSASGIEYVQTRADGRLTNNLLELPSCG